MPPIAAKDLTRDVPRSPYEELSGIPWLARLIDKARAMEAGTLGEYIPYPCGGDRGFLETVGIAPEALRQVIADGAEDEAIAGWVRENWAEDAEERLVGYRARQRGPVAPESAGYFAGARAALAAARPDLDLSAIDNFSKLICAEEGHPQP
ncbi:MAG: DUF5069 domain-containing protein [bacterium]|nr:DUF5069 domain-containing protein [bacterium]